MIEINYFQVPVNVESYDVRAMRAVRRQINERLQVKSGEHVLIVADFHTEREMIEAFASAVVGAGAVPTILLMPNSGWDPWPLRLTRIAQNTILKGEADAVIFCERSFQSTWGLPTKSSTALMTEGENTKEKTSRWLHGSEQTWKYHGVFDIDREEMEKYYDIAKRIGTLIGAGKRVRITGKGGDGYNSRNLWWGM